MSTDVFKSLPPLNWRGVDYPVTSRNVSFAHEEVQHKLERRNQDLIEMTGAHNFTFTYTIPMREGLFRGPYSAMFINGLRRLLADCKNKRPDTLIDPIYGEFRCVPTSYNDETDIQRRDGTDIRVEFRHAPEEGEDFNPTIPTINAVVSDGRDAEFAAVIVEQSTNTPANIAAVIVPEADPGSPGGTDLLSAINGFGQQIIGFGQRINANIDNQIYRMQKLEDTANTLATPESWILRRESRKSRDSSNQLRKQYSAVNAVRTVVNATPRSVASLAAELGVSVSDLAKANPGIVRSPIIRAGTVIIVPSKKNN